MLGDMGERREGKETRTWAKSLVPIISQRGRRGCGEHHVRGSWGRDNEGNVWEGSPDSNECEQLQCGSEWEV